MASAMDEFKDMMAKNVFGITKTDAIEKNICVNCKQDWEPKTHTELGRREYRISGLCEECWDSITKAD